MKHLNLLIICILFTVASCKQNHDHHHHDHHEHNATAQAESPLYKEVMAIHDAVMPEMTTIHNLKKALKAAQDDSNTKIVLDHIKKLNDADEAMMSWMAAFKTPEDSTAAKSYLKAEKVKIQAVSDLMANSILSSNQLLDSLNMVK
jgi:hypothetical protein